MTGKRAIVRSAFRKPGVMVVALLLLLCSMMPEAHAFWPFGGRGDGGSGLDLVKGYDVNTVTTIKGKIVSQTGEEGGPFLIEVRTDSGDVYLVTGPWWFWKENGFPVHAGDEVTARGSLTEGKDGRRYLLAQKLSNQRSGDEVILRGDDGVPVWANRNRASGQNHPPDSVSGPKPGGRAGAGPRGRK